MVLMRLGIFSDVHGNMEALDAVLKALKGEDVNLTICLGDLVGYGPDPNQCVEKVMEASDIVLAGNHDYAAVNLESTEHFNECARTAIEWTNEVLTSASQDILAKLPLIETIDNILTVHATPEQPEQWHYITSAEDAYRNLVNMSVPICFVGHSHVPMAFIQQEEEQILLQSAAEVDIQPGQKVIINVGSVGQPRDGDPRAAYGIFDMKENKFNLKRLAYAVRKVQEKMQKKNLPSFLIERLESGK
jgi:predicted phosphodiesterase